MACARALLVLLPLLLPGSPAPAAALAPRAFDAERAYRDLVRQCEFGPRVPNSEAHEQCARWLARELERTGARVHRQAFTRTVAGKQLRLTNIIATLNPDGRGHVILSAHWDSRPMADRDPDPSAREKPVPGANDGASGVAVLLEVARALRSRPPAQRVTIVLFDGEDYGATPAGMFLGSRAFAQRFTGPPVTWAALLDMVGDRDLRLPQEEHSLELAPQVVKRIWGAAARAGSAAFVAEPGPAILDDHLPLLARGIPCADVIDIDYAHWHTTADTPDKCSAASLGQVGRAILQAIAEDEAEAQKGQ